MLPANVFEIRSQLKTAKLFDVLTNENFKDVLAVAIQHNLTNPQMIFSEISKRSCKLATNNKVKIAVTYCLDNIFPKSGLTRIVYKNDVTLAVFNCIKDLKGIFGLFEDMKMYVSEEEAIEAMLFFYKSDLISAAEMVHYFDNNHTALFDALYQKSE